MSPRSEPSRARPAPAAGRPAFGQPVAVGLGELGGAGAGLVEVDGSGVGRPPGASPLHQLRRGVELARPAAADRRGCPSAGLDQHGDALQVEGLVDAAAEVGRRCRAPRGSHGCAAPPGLRNPPGVVLLAESAGRCSPGAARGSAGRRSPPPSREEKEEGAGEELVDLELRRPVDVGAEDGERHRGEAEGRVAGEGVLEGRRAISRTPAKRDGRGRRRRWSVGRVRRARPPRPAILRAARRGSRGRGGRAGPRPSPPRCPLSSASSPETEGGRPDQARPPARPRLPGSTGCRLASGGLPPDLP